MGFVVCVSTRVCGCSVLAAVCVWVSMCKNRQLFQGGHFIRGIQRGSKGDPQGSGTVSKDSMGSMHSKNLHQNKGKPGENAIDITLETPPFFNTLPILVFYQHGRL